MKPAPEPLRTDQRPRLNAEWHRQNRMPKNPTVGERMAWHLAHAQACACRPIPESVQAELSRRATR